MLAGIHVGMVAGDRGITLALVEFCGTAMLKDIFSVLLKGQFDILGMYI